MNDPKENAMVALKVPLARPWFDEAEAAAAAEVVASGWVIFGPRTEEFERRFAAAIGAKHAIAVNSGSSALLVAMAALGIGPGDEVIVPDMTFVSTATAAMYLGARPVFVDINLENYCIDVAKIESAVTPRTKAMVPVHFAGHTAGMDEILAVAHRRGIPVLEDAAEAHLSQYKGGKFAGTLGQIGIFSFTPSKPMTTGEGGMVVTDDDRLAEKCRLVRNFGDTDRFRWDVLGFNFRMAEVMGAIGCCQLDKLAESVRRRREIAARYTRLLAALPAVQPPRYRRIEDINFQLYTIRLDLAQLRITRDEVIARMAERGVSTRLYYPPLHGQKVFAALGTRPDSEFPNTIAYAKSALSLPIFPTMSEEEQDYVVGALGEVLGAAKVQGAR